MDTKTLMALKTVHRFLKKKMLTHIINNRLIRKYKETVQTKRNVVRTSS